MGTLDRVDVVRGCVPGAPTKIGIYQDRSGRRFQTGVGGQFMWSPQPGLRIVATTVSAKLRDANGIKASVTGPSAQWGDFDLYEGQPHDGQLRTARWSGETRRPDLVVLRLRCQWANGCPNDAGGPKAFVELFDLEIRSRDVAAPQITPSGLLWERSNGGGWHRGSGGVAIDAYDPGAGVARAWLEVNGFDVDLGSIDCPGDRGAYSTSFTPCRADACPRPQFRHHGDPFPRGLEQPAPLRRRLRHPGRGLQSHLHGDQPPRGRQPGPGAAGRPGSRRGKRLEGAERLRVPVADPGRPGFAGDCRRVPGASRGNRAAGRCRCRVRIAASFLRVDRGPGVRRVPGRVPAQGPGRKPW